MTGVYVVPLPVLAAILAMLDDLTVDPTCGSGNVLARLAEATR